MKSVVVVCLSSHDDASCKVENRANVKKRVILDRFIEERFFLSIYIWMLFMCFVIILDFQQEFQGRVRELFFIASTLHAQ